MIIKIICKRFICDYDRGIITLLYMPSKVFSRNLIKAIQDGMEQQLHVREEQADLRKGGIHVQNTLTIHSP